MIHLPVIHLPSIVVSALALGAPHMLTAQRVDLERNVRTVALYGAFVDDVDPATVQRALALVADWTQIKVTRSGIRVCAVTRAIAAAHARLVITTGAEPWVRTVEVAALTGYSPQLIESSLHTDLPAGAASRGVRTADARAWLRRRGYPFPARPDLVVSSPLSPHRARAVDVACAHP